jgi:hypothetical protein
MQIGVTKVIGTSSVFANAARNVKCVRACFTSGSELEKRICLAPIISESYSKANKDRAIAQAVSHRLPIAVARVGL